MYTSTQRGVALIVALLVVALATLLIAGLLDRGELVLARTRNQLRMAQAESYALGLEAYAAHVLQITQDQTVDATDSPWALPLPPTPVPGGTITAAMSDLNGRFNLNNLDPSASNPNAQAWHDKFQSLLKALKLDPKLADEVHAWMDPTTNATSDAFYLTQPVPYRAAKRNFMHVSELRLVRGVDGDAYAKLEPYVCALPPGTTINVNTASAPVLMTLNGLITPELAQAIWQHGHAHFQHAIDVGSAQKLPAPIDHPELYDVHSSYFLARGEITLDGLPFAFHSIIERRSSGADGGIRVLQRSRGSD
jgi:general secretion pathway protein K